VGPADLRPQADGTTLVNGTARLDDLGELLRLGLTHEDVESVSGLVLMLLNRPPEVGDEVVFRGVTLRVLSVEGRGVAECRVSPTPAAEP
jgi:CBS domain containing-hemolysin-like protein